MNLTKILQFFIPKEKKFYGMFNDAINNTVLATTELIKITSATPEQRSEIFQNIKKIEKKGDHITDNLFSELNTSFITPFDREDIHALTSNIDDIVDLIYSLSSKIEIYNFYNFNINMINMINLLHEGSNHLQIAILSLEKLSKKTTEECKKLKKIESQIDEYYHIGISDMFETEKDAIELIKQKEILLNIEKISNKMKEVSEIIKTIIIKYT